MAQDQSARPGSGLTELPEPKKKKQKPERKYSKRWKGVQELDRGVSKAVHRLTGSVEAGIGEWRKSTDKSARKKKDGAIRDALMNSAKAAGKQLRVASWAPLDLLKAVPKFSLRRFLSRAFLSFIK